MQVSSPHFTLSPNIFSHCVKILKSREPYFGHKWRQSDVMFRRFRPKIRVYENHRHGCSFKATINFLLWNDVKLVGQRNCYLGFWEFWKFLKSSKICNIFFSKVSPSKSKFPKKTYNMLEGNGWWMCPQNFKSISLKIAEIWRKTCQKEALFTSFRDYTVIFLILFFDRFWWFKKCFRVIFRVLCEDLT